MPTVYSESGGDSSSSDFFLFSLLFIRLARFQLENRPKKRHHFTGWPSVELHTQSMSTPECVSSYARGHRWWYGLAWVVKKEDMT